MSYNECSGSFTAAFMISQEEFKMKIQSVFDPSFARYGKVIKGFDTAALEAEMAKLPCPDGAVVYVPSVPELEALDIMQDFTDQLYGGMPIQIGYCNGDNHVMNCLEYHRDSELNLACTDMILLLGLEADVDFEKYEYDTSKVEAFLAPKGTLVEVYATTLHYAPINAGGKFRCTVVLPKGTNTELKFKPDPAGESRLLTHTNKWLLAHAEAPEAKNGAVVALKGENPVVNY